jgi:hypothetical protein
MSVVSQFSNLQASLGRRKEDQHGQIVLNAKKSMLNAGTDADDGASLNGSVLVAHADGCLPVEHVANLVLAMGLLGINRAG